MPIEALPGEQRERILRISTELIAKRGYQDTSIELIIARAKVGYASFYKNFPDKEALFVAIFEEALAVARERLGAVYADSGRPWSERVIAVISELFKLLAENPARARVCLVESLSAGPAVIAKHEAAVAELGRLLRDGRAEREGGERMPDTLETTIAGGIVWIAYQLLVIGEGDRLAGEVPEAIQFALSPYLGEEAAAKAAAASAAAAS